MEKEKNKFSECIHCERFFECKLKKDKPTNCLHFKERTDEEWQMSNG